MRLALLMVILVTGCVVPDRQVTMSGKRFHGADATRLAEAKYWQAYARERITAKDYVKAEVGFLAALNLRRAVLGNNDPDIGATIWELGNLYAMQGEYIRPSLLFHEVEKQLAKQSSLVAAIYLTNLAGSYMDFRQMTRAETVLRRAIEIFEQPYGYRNPMSPLAQIRLARIFVLQDRLEAANLTIRGAITTLKKQVAESILSDPEDRCVSSTLTAYLTYSDILNRQHRFSEQTTVLKNAAKYANHFGIKSHCINVTFIDRLAKSYISTGKYDDAEREYEKLDRILVASMRHPWMRPDPQQKAPIVAGRGLIAEARKQYKKAEIYIREAIALHASFEDPSKENLDLSELFVVLARVLAQQGKFAESLPFWFDSQDLNEKALKKRRFAVSESEYTRLLEDFHRQHNDIYDLVVQSLSSSELAHAALSFAFSHQGRILDEIASFNFTLQHQVAEKERKRFLQLCHLRSMISNMTFNNWAEINKSNSGNTFDELVNRANIIEAELSHGSAGLRFSRELRRAARSYRRSRRSYPRTQCW